MHGEEGLKEDFHGGGQYESWHFYNEEFGRKFYLFMLSISNCHRISKLLNSVHSKSNYGAFVFMSEMTYSYNS